MTTPEPPPPYPGYSEKAAPPPAYPPQPFPPTVPPANQYGGYPPANMQQPGFQPNPTVVINQQPGVSTTVVTQMFRESPIQTVCPTCQAQIVTSVGYETGTFTWLVCAILCLVGCDCGCCLIPFCVDGCKDVYHTCPNCRSVVGRWNRL